MPPIALNERLPLSTGAGLRSVEVQALGGLQGQNDCSLPGPRHYRGADAIRRLRLRREGDPRRAHPGRSQLHLALTAAGGALRSGKGIDQAVIAAKSTAAFAGPMRINLVRMLDGIGMQTALDVPSCAELSAAALTW
jgi:hypothetical protein